jgi:FtsH-binding integral membrane protein
VSFLVPKSKFKTILLIVCKKTKNIYTSLYNYLKKKVKVITKKYRKITASVVMILSSIAVIYLPVNKEIKFYLFVLMSSILIMFISSLVKVPYNKINTFRGMMYSILLCVGPNLLTFSILSLILYFNSWKLERVGLGFIVVLIAILVTYLVSISYHCFNLLKLVKQKK